MEAFHTNWTKPFFARNKTGKYFIEDFEILTTILSALEWRRHNGCIRMVTDKIGAEYYHDLGIGHIWNLGIDDTLENSVDECIDPSIFWAVGKIFALYKQKAPCVMMDTDFIVWKPIQEILEGEKLAVIHMEDVRKGCYPDKANFKMTENYKFPLEWDLTSYVCNASLVYISDESFKNFFTDQSIHFMKNYRGEPGKVMTSAEQRILTMCAIMKGIPVKSLVDFENPNKEMSQFFLHLCGYKRVMEIDITRRKIFCLRYLKKLLEDFPEMEETLVKIKSFAIYNKEAL
jgi:hypothetical protein